MITPSFKRSRSPAQNLRWGLRHVIYLSIFGAILLVDRGEFPLEPLVFAVILIGIVCNIVYFAGYLIIAGFWVVLGKFPKLRDRFVRSSVPSIEDLNLWYQEALSEFKSFRFTPPESQFAFDGSSAEIVKVERSGESDRPDRSDFTVTIYARNGAGEYFLFKKNPASKPYFKHVARNMAEEVLKLNSAIST